MPTGKLGGTALQPLYIAFHTGGDYERHAQELIETLDRFGLRHTVWQLPDAGSWTRCCALKSLFVKQSMELYPGSPLVYLDADARVRRKPQLFDRIAPDVDFGCHYLDGHELLSGTLYFGGTIGAAEIVNQWHRRCTINPDIWDQQHLQAVVQEGRFNVLNLPEEYCRIFDRPTPANDVVIEHLQESRNQRAKGRQ